MSHTVSTDFTDQLPPHSVEAEQAVLDRTAARRAQHDAVKGR